MPLGINTMEALFALVIGSLSAVAIAAQPSRPVIVEGSVVEVDAFVATDALSAYLIEVDEVISGFVPMSLTAVDEAGGELPIGAQVHLVLRQRDDLNYLILSWRLVPEETEEDPTPGGLLTVPADGSSRDVQPMGGGPSVEEEIVALVNIERLNHGSLPPLKHNGLLDSSAELHSSNMSSRDFFGHCDLDTATSHSDRITAAGYAWSSAGENIAAGYTTPSAVMAAWMASAGHRNNILRTTFREIGVGYVFDSSDSGNVRVDQNADCIVDLNNQGPYRHYWTQNFGRRNSVYPLVIAREAYETTSQLVGLYVYGEGVAVDMRFRNESGSWSPWEPYMPDKIWLLSNGDGTKQVEVETRDAGLTVRSAVDTIELNVVCGVGDATLNLSAQTVTTTESFQACTQITVGNGFAVDSPGDATFQAPIVVVVNDFSVGPGATVTMLNTVP